MTAKVKEARPRRGTTVPAKRGKRKGKTIKETTIETPVPGNLTRALIERQPTDNREFVEWQGRHIAAIADEMRLRRRKANSQERNLSSAEIDELINEAKLRMWAAKLTLGNRDPLNDLGVDRLETCITEEPWPEKE